MQSSGVVAERSLTNVAVVWERIAERTFENTQRVS
jgi:hypothetical protein